MVWPAAVSPALRATSIKPAGHQPTPLYGPAFGDAQGGSAEPLSRAVDPSLGGVDMIDAPRWRRWSP